MEKILLELEQSFFKYKYISDRQWLSDILHPDFSECGFAFIRRRDFLKKCLKRFEIQPCNDI